MCFFLRCVFFGGDFNVTTPQRRSSTHSLSQSHTHTLTHTHDWPTVADRSSGSRYFSGFANIFEPEKGSQEFFDRQGVTQHPKIFPECYKCFQLFMYVFFFDAGIMLHLRGYVR